MQLLGRLTVAMLLLASSGAMLSGCGASNTPSRETETLVEKVVPPAKQSQTTCMPPAAPRPLRRGTPNAVHLARIDDAAERSTRSSRRFATKLELMLGDVPIGSATLRATRFANGSSRGTLRTRGAMALISPDTDLRIRNNTLYTREREAGDGAGAGPWRNRGSASGVSLDVGRELLMHPFLLEPAATRKTRGTIRGSYAVEPRAFRSYVADERNGLVTDLLQDASSLTLDATTRNGQLWSDSFALTTRIPRSLEPRLAGRTLMLTGVTQTCA